MSPLFCGARFTSPRQQRGAIGLMAAITLGLVLIMMLLVIDSGRLYLEQRKLQRVADMAVLEAVSRGGNCISGTALDFARQSATRNAFTPNTAQTIAVSCGTLVTNAKSLRTFSADPSKSDAIRVIATNTLPTSVAGGMWNLYYNGKFGFNSTLTASAVGAVPKSTLAQLTIRSTAAAVSSSQSTLLNLVWGKMLGGNLNLDVAGWQGLVDSKINLLSFLDQLAIDVKLNAGNYTDVLNSNIQATQLIDTAIKVLTVNGTTTNLAVTGLLGLKTAIGSVKLKLSDILKLQTGTSSAGLDTNVNVFQLAEAFVQLANISNGVMASIPLNIPGVVNGEVKVRVIEPPQISAIGDPAKAKAAPNDVNSRIYVRTAQIRTGVTINLPLLDIPLVNNVLNDLVVPLSDTLNSLLKLDLAGTLSSVLCLVLTCERTDLKIFPNTKTINVVVEAASADTRVTDYSCATNNKSLSTSTNAALVKVKFGSIDMTNAFSSSADVVVKPLTIVDIGAITCSGLVIKTCNLATRKPFYGGGIGLSVDTSVASLPISAGPDIYSNPPDIKLPPLYKGPKNTGITGSLKTTLSGIHLDVYKATSTGVLGALVTGIGNILNALISTLSTLIGAVLAPIVDPILDQLLTSLGINLNVVDVGANLTCGNQGGRAQLVL